MVPRPPEPPNTTRQGEPAKREKVREMAKKALRVVELFAGVGGFRLGLEGIKTKAFRLAGASSRFKTVWANQWEPGKTRQHAVTIYNDRFGKDANMVNEDVATVIDQVPEHELLVGGFPCQDYSVAHTGAEGIRGKKGVLWWSIDKIIAKRTPPYVLLENVDRLLKSPAAQRGRDFGIILRCLLDKGYAVEWRVINAADYGQAQRRRRTFIFAYHKKTSAYKKLARKFNDYQNDALVASLFQDGFFSKVFPVELKLSDKNNRKITKAKIGADVYADLEVLSNDFKAPLYSSGIMFEGRLWSMETTPKYVDAIPLSETREAGDVDEKYFLGANLEQWTFLKGAKSIKRVDKKTGYEYNFAEGPVAFPDKLDMPSRTMLTSESSVNRSTHVIEDAQTGRLRLLTPVECERLNGFPDGWTDVASVPEKFRYFAMGNALVVPLIKMMGKEIVRLVDEDNQSRAVKIVKKFLAYLTDLTRDAFDADEQ